MSLLRIWRSAFNVYRTSFILNKLALTRVARAHPTYCVLLVDLRKLVICLTSKAATAVNIGEQKICAHCCVTLQSLQQSLE